jgi:serine/threonine protein kinase
MCAALARAHDLGVIHRDLKSDNILLTQRGGRKDFVKILDFGLAAIARDPRLAPKGAVFGTPEYMSPEQARGVKDIDPRTDLYSMGVIMYEAVTGRLPFHSENVGDLIIQVVTGTAPTVQSLMPEVPLELSRVIERAMARKREDRFSSAAEMQSALLDVTAIQTPRASRMLSDMPPLERTEGSGTRRLTPSERVTLADQDSLPASRILADDNDSDSKRPTTDALEAIPPVTQTLKTVVLRGHTKASRSRRYALLLMAAAATSYTAFILVHARQRDSERPQTTAVSIASAELTAPAERIVMTPASGPVTPAVAPTQTLDPKRAPRTRVIGSEDQVVEVVVSDKVEPLKAADAPAPKPKRARVTAKLRKAQGALRNLDF